MNKQQLSLVIAGVAAVAVVAGGWFLGVQPQLAIASTNQSQREKIDATNAQNQAELGRLQEKFQSLAAMKSDLSSLEESVPSTAQTGPFVSSVNTAAEEAGVSITTLTVADAQSYVPPKPAAGSGSAPASGTATASPSASASATAAPSVPATPTAPELHTDPSITGENFSVLPVTVAFSGDYAKALVFTKAVQTGPRLFLVNGLSSTTSDGGEEMWSLTGYIYVLSSATSTTASSTSAAANTNG